MTHTAKTELIPLRNDGGDALEPAALPPVRSEPLLAGAVAAIRALVEALECYTAVHGADDDDEQALALGRDVLSKANNVVRGAEPSAGPRTSPPNGSEVSS